MKQMGLFGAVMLATMGIGLWFLNSSSPPAAATTPPTAAAAGPTLSPEALKLQKEIDDLYREHILLIGKQSDLVDDLLEVSKELSPCAEKVKRDSERLNDLKLQMIQSKDAAALKVSAEAYRKFQKELKPKQEELARLQQKVRDLVKDAADNARKLKRKTEELQEHPSGDLLAQRLKKITNQEVLRLRNRHAAVIAQQANAFREIGYVIEQMISEAEEAKERMAKEKSPFPTYFGPRFELQLKLNTFSRQLDATITERQKIRDELHRLGEASDW